MIQQILIPEFSAASYGLKPALLHGLGQVVLLAGPNGAGKSRYLKLIAELAKVAEDIRLVKLKGEMLGINVNIDTSAITKEQFEKNVEQVRSTMEKMGTEQSEINNTINKVIVKAQALKGLRYTQNCRTVLLDYQDFTSAEIINRDDISMRKLAPLFADIETSNFADAYKKIHMYLAYIAQTLYDSEHPRTKTAAQAEQIKAALDFNRILYGLIGTEVNYDLGSHFYVVPRLFGREFDEAELSAGQLILITWAIALHRQGGILGDSIVIIDEPETHLHADMCIEALESLRINILGEHGQMWIATHCPALIAHFGVQSVYFVKNNSIQYAGAGRIEEVMDSILGGEGGRQKLATALLDAELVARTNFELQCVLPAGVAEHQAGDKQEQQFTKALQQLLAEPDRVVRLLDYSAGKGRFATALSDRRCTEPTGFWGRVEYHAYNDRRFTSEPIREACLRQLADLSQPGNPRDYYWESLAELKARQGERFDLVVLSNVLHEVDVREWRPLFADIAALLTPAGRLVLIEDLLPPVGELPNMWGYIILDVCGFEKLFGDRDAVQVLDLQENRLLAIAVTQPKVAIVTSENVRAALLYLADKANEEIINIRSLPPEQRKHQSGRKHAHYTMLYTNTALALKQL